MAHVIAEIVAKAVYKVSKYKAKRSDLYKIQLPAWWARAKLHGEDLYVTVEFLSDGSLRIRPSEPHELEEAGRNGGKFTLSEE